MAVVLLKRIGTLHRELLVGSGNASRYARAAQSADVSAEICQKS
jgi:hypothetical protein